MKAMAAWWRRRRGGGTRARRMAAGAGRSPAAEGVSMRGPLDYLPLPGETPFEMLRVYRFLRDAIPDVSDGVWTWKRLCHTGHRVEIAGAATDGERDRAFALIRALDGRVNGGDRGMDGLLDIFYTALFTYGAGAVELVPSASREGVHDVVPVDVWTVRFRREGGVAQPYQLQEGSAVRLPRERFLYLGLDRDGTNPYGRSILASIPFLVKIQQQLLRDMAKATRNAGWSKLHVQFTPDPRRRGETDEAYQARIDAEFDELRDRLSGMEADQNLVTYENIQVNLIRGDQRSLVFYENQKAIEEQVITGMHLMPILLGRNYGSTETYGTAQFEVINRQVETVNRGVQRMLERLYNVELALAGCGCRARVVMGHNQTVDALKDANARGQAIDNAVRLRDEGFVDQAGAARLLGLDGQD